MKVGSPVVNLKDPVRHGMGVIRSVTRDGKLVIVFPRTGVCKLDPFDVELWDVFMGGQTDVLSDELLAELSTPGGPA